MSSPRAKTCRKNRKAYQNVEAVVIDTRPNRRGTVVAVRRSGRWRWPRLNDTESAPEGAPYFSTTERINLLLRHGECVR